MMPPRLRYWLIEKQLYLVIIGALFVVLSWLNFVFFQNRSLAFQDVDFRLSSTTICEKTEQFPMTFSFAFDADPTSILFRGQFWHSDTNLPIIRPTFDETWLITDRGTYTITRSLVVPPLERGEYEFHLAASSSNFSSRVWSIPFAVVPCQEVP